jgi:hypothetical protein
MDRCQHRPGGHFYHDSFGGDALVLKFTGQDFTTIQFKLDDFGETNQQIDHWQNYGQPDTERRRQRYFGFVASCPNRWDLSSPIPK